jgi:peptidyl-prolyl cis-trans isomerase C
MKSDLFNSKGSTMNSSRFLSIAVWYLALGLPIAAIAQNGEAAKVNGVTIPQARIDMLAKSQTAQGQPDTPELRTRIKDFLVTREIMAQEATKRGLDKTAEVHTQMELTRQEVLVNAYIADYLKRNPVSEDVLKKEYERVKGQVGDKEFKAHHILVKTEDEAKQIIAQIKKGAAFEKVAAEKSEDSSKAQGGDLGWSGPERYVQPFGDALKKLKKGQMTDTPVQSQFGWHVIRLDEERARKFPPYDEAKVQIQQQMQQQAVQKGIADLRAKAKVE